jgi:hypothetical protein
MVAVPSLSPRQTFFGVMASIAVLFALKSILWPRWPTASPLNSKAVAPKLVDNGFDAQPLPKLPAKRNYDWATSEGLAYGIGEGQTLRLVRGTGRERLAFSASVLAASDPSLRLQKRILLASQPPSAKGINQGTPVRQTCLVIGKANQGGYGVTGTELLPLIDQLPTDRSDRLRSLLGLQLPRRYECVLISVSGGRPGSGGIDDERWQKLLNAIRPALGHQTDGS